MFQLALFEPEIPPNTGNIIRLCANTGVALHLIEPLGFSINDKALRRAGLDYREYTDMQLHRSYDEFKQSQINPRIFAFTTRAQTSLFDVKFQHKDVLLFGPETRGLPDAVLHDVGDTHWLRIPMLAASRSLNLSNAAAIAVYEAWRQHEFLGV